MIRNNGRLEPATWEEAAQFIAERLAHLSGSVGIAVRSDATLEEGVAAKALAEHLNAQAEHFPRPAASVIVKNPATFTDVATSDAIFVIGDPTEELPTLDLRIKDALKGVTPPALLPHGVPIADLRLKERMPRKKGILTVAAPYRTDLMRHAGQSFVYPAGQERALFEGLQKGNAKIIGLETKGLVQLRTALKEADNPVIVLGAFVLASAEATQAAEAFAELVGAKVMKLGPSANAYGLEATGVVSEKGYTKLLTERDALILSNLDPAQNADIATRLEQLELLVVHDSFETETTKLAHVVLPAKTGYEKEGTVVNLEGRFLGVYPAPVDGGSSQDFLGVVRALGEALGVRLAGRSVRSARRELAKTFDIDFAALPEEGVLAPVEAKGAGQTPVQAAQGNLLLVPSFLKIDRLSRNPKLRAAHGDAALRVHPEDAKALGLEAGKPVTLSVGGVTRKAIVKVTETAPEGTLLLPATFDQPASLTSAEVVPQPEPVSA